VLPQGRRSYGQRCAVARALDYLGERWTLLLVRELMVGPKRFKDLFDGLPGIGTNLLSGRLKGLEQAGIVSRRILPPPAGSTVYELTELGLGLEPVVFALGRWGHQFLSLRLPGEIWKPGWLMVALRAAFRADKVAGIRARYELRIDGEVFQMEIAGDKLRVAQGPPSDPDMTLTTDMRTFVGLVSGTVSPHDALRSGKASVQKGPQELRRFVALFAWGARFQELEGGAARHSQGGVGR
jgi:DNA-binding HxlR family transcriptional regulator/putative sterol carrier protein